MSTVSQGWEAFLQEARRRREGHSGFLLFSGWIQCPISRLGIVSDGKDWHISLGSRGKTLPKGFFRLLKGGNAGEKALPLSAQILVQVPTLSGRLGLPLRGYRVSGGQENLPDVGTHAVYCGAMHSTLTALIKSRVAVLNPSGIARRARHTPRTPGQGCSRKNSAHYLAH